MIFTSRTLPDWANRSCRSSSVVANERLPTYNFTDISSVLNTRLSSSRHVLGLWTRVVPTILCSSQFPNEKKSLSYQFNSYRLRQDRHRFKRLFQKSVFPCSYKSFFPLKRYWDFDVGCQTLTDRTGQCSLFECLAFRMIFRQRHFDYHFKPSNAAKRVGDHLFLNSHLCPAHVDVMTLCQDSHRCSHAC